jgi:HK97 family phage portal protein
VAQFLPAVRGLLGLGGLETKGLAERIRSSASAYVVPGQPYRQSKWNVKKAVEEAYQGNPLVYRAIEVMCQNAIARKIVFRRGDPEDGKIISKISDDPTRLLYVLNRRANPWETAKIFRHRLVAQYALSSKGVYIEVIRTRAGGIGILNILDPDLCEKIPYEKRDPATGKVIEFDPVGTLQYQVASGGYNYLPRFDPTKSALQQPAAYLWVRSPHPTVMWEGMSPTEAAAMSIDLDRYARHYNRRFLQNDGRPGGLISIKGVVSQEAEERVQAQFMGGPESAGRPVVIAADQVSYVDTSATPRDMMWDNLQKFTRTDIAIAFGVPESVLGDASGRTFDNADAEYSMFWEHRMGPLLASLDDQLDVLTGSTWDDDLFLWHNTSDVWVLGRHQREREDRAADDLERGAITVDEYRVITGRDPWDVPATRVLYIPSSRIPVGDAEHPGDADDVAQLQQLGMGQPADPGAEAQAGAEIGSRAGVRAAENVNNATQLRLVAGEGRSSPGLERRDLLGGRVVLELEGEQSRARPGDEGEPGGPAEWR